MAYNNNFDEFPNYDVVLGTGTQDKVSALAEAKRNKLDRLGSRSDNANLSSGTYTVTDDGYAESNSNKLWNDYSASEIQGEVANAAKEALYTNEDGSLYQLDQSGSKVPYNGATRRAYMYGSKDDTDKVKFGLSRGDLPSSDYRYQPGLAESEGYNVGRNGYGWESGISGVSLDKPMLFDSTSGEAGMLLPDATATRLEALIHGRKSALDGRSVRDVTNPETMAEYGSGISEYYNSTVGMLGDSRVDDRDTSRLPINVAAERSANRLDNVSYEDDEAAKIVANLRKYKKDRAIPVLTEASQIVPSALAAAGKGALGIADAAQELLTWGPQTAVRMWTGDDTYDIDLISDAAKDKIGAGIDNVVGYDRASDEESLKLITDYIELSGIDITDPKSLRKLVTSTDTNTAIGRAFVEAMKNPSVAASAIGEILGAGFGLGIATKVGTKLATKVAPELSDKVGAVLATNKSAVDTEIASIRSSTLGTYSKTQAIKKAQDSYTIAKRLPDLLKGSVYTNADLAIRMNNDMDEFATNNDGETPSPEKVLSMFVLNRITSSMEVGSLKYATKIKDIAPEALQKSLKSAVADSMEHLSKSGLTEAGQETLDGIVQQINQKLGSSDYQDYTLEQILEETSSEILTGTIVGGTAGVQLSSLSEATKGLRAGTSKLGAIKAEIAARKVKSNEDVVDVADVAGDIDPEENVKILTESAHRIGSGIIQGKLPIKEDNVHGYVSDIENVKELLNALPESEPKRVQIQGVYDKGVDALEVFVKENPDIKLNKKSLEEFNKVLGSEDGGYTEASRAATAERLVRTILGSEREYEDTFKAQLTKFMTNNNVDEEKAIKVVKSYASVDLEATVEERGYSTMEATLKSLLSDEAPDKAKIKKTYSQLNRFLDSTSKSISDINDGVTEANIVAKTMNSSKVPVANNPKAKQVPTNYRKADGTPYNINVTYNKKTKKWVPNTTDILKRLAKKKVTSKEITRILRETGNTTSSVVEGVSVSNKFNTPSPDGTTNKAVSTSRKGDATYYATAEKLIEEYTGNNYPINKVILDESVDDVKGKPNKGYKPKWANNGDYKNLNNDKVNSLTSKDEAYLPSDVVLVHALGQLELKGGIKTTRLYKKKDNVARDELLNAMAVGASIVLDREYRDSADGKAVVKAVSAILKKGGYRQLPSSNTFVKDSDEVAAKVSETNSAKASKGAATKKTNKNIEALTDTLGLLEAKVDDNGDPLSDKDVSELRIKYNKEVTNVAKLSNKSVDAVEKSIKSKLKARVKAVKKELTIKDIDDADKLYEKVYIEKLAETEYADELSNDAKVTKLLEGWKVLTEESRLEGKALDNGIKQLSNKLEIDVVPKSLSDELLGEVSVARGKPPLWEKVYKVDTYKNSKIISSEIKYVPVWKAVSQRTMEAFRKGKAVLNNNKKTTPVTYRKVDNDTTSYLKTTKTTVLNTVPLDTLPKVFKDTYYSFNKAFYKVIPMASAAELGNVDNFKTSRSGNLDLHNSPARGLVFDETKTRTEVLLAMKVALINSITTDKQKLKKGYKTNKDLALMFGVREHEVNKDIREFASDIGSFKKTVATKIGKDTLKLLGITKVDLDTQGEGNFSRLVADLGNMALLVGKEEGLIEFVDKPANELNALISGTEASMVSDQVNVTFINIASYKDKDTNRFVPSDKVEAVIEDAKAIGEIVPETKTREVWPSLVKPTKGELDKLSRTVRNDSIGMEVPEVARDALRAQMETPFIFDVKRVEEFLSTVDDNPETVKGVLGYVELDSDKYEEMAFEDKDVQEAINDSIDKSIDDLRRFLVSNKHRAKDGKVELYFEFNYVSNGRYHLDSNTINPQSDKLHRFLVMPKALEAEFKVDGSNFTIGGVDVNFNLRAAIGQAMGYGVDKASTEDIIDWGNAMLSLSAKQLVEVRKNLLTTGKAEVYSGTKVYELEAEHLTHTLQALDFLDAVAKGDTSVVSSLSLEFDSLTSGFANKIQQFPILDGVMHEQLARVGIITKEYQSSVLGKEVVNPANGTAMNDLLASGDTLGFLDSYKNLAKLTLEGMKDLVSGMVGEDKRTADIFKGLAPSLPGGNAVIGKASMDIDSSMRSLFKNPFMIFNYSASISTITNTLAENIVRGVFKDIAKADLTNKDDNGTKVATYVVKRFGKLTGIKTVSGLQEATRTEGPGFVGNGKLFKELLKPIKATYGFQVKEVFEAEFSQYIQLQDTTNDAFKVMFRLFDSKRIELLKAAGLKGYVTKKDQNDILEALWSDFPYIAGPLSDKGKLKEIIPVMDRVVGSPSVVEESAKPPQTRVNGKPTTNKVRPLITSIGEAASAGSVLPFHFIDGAEIAMMLKGFKEYLGDGKDAGVLAIHDAVIPSLVNADRIQWEYNKGMYEVNNDYSITENLAKRMDELNIDTKYVESISTLGLKVATDDKGKHTGMKFSDAVELIKADVKWQAEDIKKARDKWYTGPLKDAWFGNMVGSPAGVYQVGMTEPDMSYVDKYKDNYKKRKVTLKASKVVDNKTKDNKLKAKTKETTPKDMSRRFRRIKDECAL